MRTLIFDLQRFGSYIVGTDGDDSLSNRNNSYSTITVGEGNDTIYNYCSSYSIILAGAGNDSVYNYSWAGSTTINAGAGDDTILNENYCYNVSISGGAGNDYIYNTDSSYRSTLLGGSGNDTIYNNSTTNYIDGGVGDDSIYNRGNNTNTTIVGGRGNDIIYNQGGNTKIDAGDGNDSIYVDMFSTINAGAGNDTIVLGVNGQLIQYALDDGNDVIYYFDEGNTLQLMNGASYSTVESGDDIIVRVGSGSITLKDAVDLELNIEGTYVEGGDDGDADADNDADSDSDSDADSDSDSDSTVNSIANSLSNVLISGTDDAESITNSGSNVTIQGNGSDDTVTGSTDGEVILVASDHGNDLITNFGVNDTLKCTAGNIATLTTVGDDAIVSLNGSAYSSMITLEGAGDYNFILDGNVLTVLNAVTNNKNNVQINGTSGVDSIVNYGSGVSINPGAGNDTIVGLNNGEMYLLSSAFGDNVITNFGANDTIRMTSGKTMTFATVGADVVVTLQGASYTGYETLVGAAGLNFQKSSDGTYLYVDNINTVVNTANNRLVTGTDGRDSIENHGSGVTINPGAGDDTMTGSDVYGELYHFSSAYGDNVITNFGANDTIFMASGKTLSFATVGSDVVVTLKGASYTGHETLKGAAGMDFVKSADGKYLYVNDVSTLTNAANNVKFAGTSSAEYMLNSGSKVTIDGKGGGDTIEGSNFGDLFQMSSAYGDNVIINFDANDSLQMIAGKTMTWSKKSDDVIVTIKGASYTGTVTLKDAADNNFVVKNNVLYIDNGAPTLTNTADAIKFSGTADAEYMINSGSGVTIDGKGGGDTIEGSNFGDLFQMSSAYGNNVILNFDANDTLQMIAGQTMTWSTSGADAIVTIKGASYTGTVTLKDAANNNFVVKNKFLYINNGTPTLTNTDDAIKFNGTEDAEWMINVGERVTIEPKTGNDTIDASEDYGELINLSSADGNNVILNFGKSDSLQMTAGKTLSFATVGSDVIVTLKGNAYTGYETLKGAAGLNFVKSANGKILHVDAAPDPIINSKDKVKVTGTDEKDYIINTGQGVSIAAGAGNDTIEGSDLYGEMFMVSSADGHDTITNFGANDTIYMSAGKTLTWSTVGADVIVTLKGTSYTGTMTLKDAAGLDFKKSSNGKYLVVDSGINYITNGKDNVKVTGTDGVDWIENSGAKVTIEAKGGNDTVVGSSFDEMFLFSGADGDNLVMNFGVNDTLKCTSGTIDRVEKSGGNAIVRLKSGNALSTITLEGAGEYDFEQTSTVLTVKHDNRIINRSDKEAVDGTSGDDIIVNYGANVTITPGTGNDTITGSDEYGEVFALSSAYGNNVITNFGYNDTLRMTAGKTLSFATVGADVVVTLKGNAYTGYETLKGAAGLPFKKVTGTTLVVDGVTTKLNTRNNTLVGGTEGRDYITNTGSGVTIQGSANDDTIVGSDEYGEMFQWSSAYGDDVIINFHSNDTLYMASGKTMSFATVGADVLVTLKGTAYTGTVTLKDAAGLDFKKSSSGKYLTAAGVSTIVNNSNNVKVVGTSNNDYIVNAASGVTIQSNAGDDTIEGADFAELYLFSSGDGNNVITNFGTNDTLRLTTGSITSYYASSNDYVVEFGQGAVTLKDVGAISVNGTNVTATQTNNQMVAEEYWFDVGSDAESPLNEILSTEAAIDLSTEFLIPPAHPKQASLLTFDGSARHRQK